MRIRGEVTRLCRSDSFYCYLDETKIESAQVVFDLVVVMLGMWGNEIL